MDVRFPGFPIQSRAGRARSTRLGAVAFALLTLASIAFRLVETGGTPVAWLRAEFSLVALWVLFGLRSEALAKRAVLAFCIEAAGAIAIFMLVDVPMVHQHERDIGEAAIAGYAAIDHRDLRTDLIASGLIGGRAASGQPAAIVR